MFNISSQLPLTLNKRNLESDNDITTTQTNMNIYNEDEKMIIFNIENEESEDDVEFDINNNNESSEDHDTEFDINDYERANHDYERIMEFNKSDEEDDNNKEETSEEKSDKEVIINKPLSNEQIPQTFGEFASYFKNITESLFFCWMQKH